jgi:hypothetical protein
MVTMPFCLDPFFVGGAVHHNYFNFKISTFTLTSIFLNLDQNYFKPISSFDVIKIQE